MKARELATDEMNQRGMRALVRELGPAGAVEFLRKVEGRRGDYTRDRHLWLDKVNLDEAFDSVLQRQEQRKSRSGAKTTKKERKRSA